MNVACSTCLDLITLKCDVCITPCGHLFHTKCIKEWLNTDKWANIAKGIQKSCPQCRGYCETLIKVYFNEDMEAESKLDKLEAKSELLKSEVTKLQNERQTWRKKWKNLKGIIITMQMLKQKQVYLSKNQGN